MVKNFDSEINAHEILIWPRLIPGWSRVMPEFNVARYIYKSNSDGTVSPMTGYGMGVMFLPSGLGYYASQFKLQFRRILI